jgi:biopolymer transport protein TolQ
MRGNADIIGMVLGAGPVVQFVLIVLVIMSVLCWTIIIVKARLLKQASSSNEEFDIFFSEASGMAQVESRARRMKGSPMAQVFLTAYSEYQKLQSDVKLDNVRLKRTAWIDVLSRSIEKGIKLEIQELEIMIPLLATTGNSAPLSGFLALYGGS